jgi:hypothetical protein
LSCLSRRGPIWRKGRGPRTSADLVRRARRTAFWLPNRAPGRAADNGTATGGRLCCRPIPFRRRHRGGFAGAKPLHHGFQGLLSTSATTVSDSLGTCRIQGSTA